MRTGWQPPARATAPSLDRGNGRSSQPARWGHPELQEQLTAREVLVRQVPMCEITPVVRRPADVAGQPQILSLGKDRKQEDDRGRRVKFLRSKPADAVAS